MTVDAVLTYIRQQAIAWRDEELQALRIHDDVKAERFRFAAYVLEQLATDLERQAAA